VYQRFGRVTGILHNLDASLIVVYVENMIAGNGAILILWWMPGHCNAICGYIQDGKILRIAWHCNEQES